MNFAEAWVIASKVDGTLTIEEAKELWRASQTASGDVVDVGCGLRICLLLAADGPITSAIPFDEFDDESYIKWRDQIVGSGFAKNVFVAKKEPNLYHEWESPVGFLLLDRRNAAQLQGWKQHLVSGASVAIFNFSEDVPDDFKIERKVGAITTLRYSPNVT